MTPKNKSTNHCLTCSNTATATGKSRLQIFMMALLFSTNIVANELPYGWLVTNGFRNQAKIALVKPPPESKQYFEKTIWADSGAESSQGANLWFINGKGVQASQPHTTDSVQMEGEPHDCSTLGSHTAISVAHGVSKPLQELEKTIWADQEPNLNMHLHTTDSARTTGFPLRDESTGKIPP